MPVYLAVQYHRLQRLVGEAQDVVKRRGTAGHVNGAVEVFQGFSFRYPLPTYVNEESANAAPRVNVIPAGVVVSLL